jgi:hypothetical protein
VKKSLLLLVALTFAAPAYGQSLEVVGYAGDLGEWEVTASLTGKTSFWSKDFAGPLTMRHSGICTIEGPKEKTGEISLQISRWTLGLQATVMLDGVACSYSGRKLDFYAGVLNCADRRIPLKLWLRE